MLPDFRLHYKATVTKTVQFLCLAQNQTCKSMKQDGKSRNKPMRL